jgi:hypothetical protein
MRYPNEKHPRDSYLRIKTILVGTVKNFTNTEGSPFLSEFFSTPYLTVPYRTVTQQTVYLSKKYRTIQTDFVLKTQFAVNRSVTKIHFFPFLTLKS